MLTETSPVPLVVGEPPGFPGAEFEDQDLLITLLPRGLHWPPQDRALPSADTSINQQYLLSPLTLLVEY